VTSRKAGCWVTITARGVPAHAGTSPDEGRSALRALAREHAGLDLAGCGTLLASADHEARLLALLILVGAYPTAEPPGRSAIYRLYLDSTARINNWDLVDASAPNIVGRHLEERSRAPLRRLARSRSLWERRIAIVATLRFIRQEDFGDTLAVADLLLHDAHDLIHKATGWMLREVGKRDRAALEAFLRPRYASMPRTMLRYAIERFPEPLRLRYLRGRV
jgi:3-methyladenine DNA glycosylase AlkD